MGKNTRQGRIDWLTNGVEDFMRRKLLGSELSGRKCALADAQFVIARAHGFESWPKFAKHLLALARKGSPIAKFETATDAIIHGKTATLKRLLKENPETLKRIEHEVKVKLGLPVRESEVKPEPVSVAKAAASEKK